jgi:hypothetical protein
LGELEGDDGMHEPLLSPVVQVADDAAAGLVGRGDQPRARGRQLVPAVRICDGRIDQLCEPRHPLLGVGGGNCSPLQRAEITPHSRPSTTTGAPTLTRMPMLLTISAIGPCAPLKSSSRAARSDGSPTRRRWAAR